MRNKKKETFVFKGLGFPIKLINVPMKKVLGEWCIDVNMNKLMLVVLEALIHKPTALTGGELRFIRSYLDLTTTEFGELFGVSHVAVLKWEKEKNRMSSALELYIRLHVSDYLKVKDKEFRALYKELSLNQLSKESKRKVHPIAVDAATEDLKIAQ